MFRFSYKWVAGVEFGISGLYGLASFALLGWLREQFAAMHRDEKRSVASVGRRRTLVAMPVIFSFRSSFLR